MLQGSEITPVSAIMHLCYSAVFLYIPVYIISWFITYNSTITDMYHAKYRLYPCITPLTLPLTAS